MSSCIHKVLECIYNQWAPVKTLTRPQKVSFPSSAVLTQKQDWRGLSRSWQPYRTACLLPGFLTVPVCCFCPLTFHSETFQSFLQATTSLPLLSKQQFLFSQRQSSCPPGSEMDSSSSFIPLCPFSFCLCRQIKGKQEDKRFPDSREQREKCLCVAYKTASFTLAVCPWTPPSDETEPGDIWAFLEVSLKHQSLYQHGRHFLNTHIFSYQEYVWISVVMQRFPGNLRSLLFFMCKICDFILWVIFMTLCFSVVSEVLLLLSEKLEYEGVITWFRSMSSFRN